MDQNSHPWSSNDSDLKEMLHAENDEEEEEESNTGGATVFEGDFRMKTRRRRRGLDFHFQEITRFNMKEGGGRM